jgi:hypothetical protein
MNNKPICTSSQIYGRKAISIDPNGNKHISDNSVCKNVADIKRGDRLHIETTYDSEEHPYDLNMVKNGFETIMAINNVSTSGNCA